MLMMKAGVFQPTRLVCLHRIEPEHARITLGGNGELRIGAMATFSELEHDPNVAARLPVLKRAMRTLSNVRVRNVARVGGALAHGDPHMDLPPVLTALGARVSISGPNRNREMPLEAALCRLLRDRSGKERADHRGDGAGARTAARPPT